jgi:hypothetical protein
MKLTASCKKQRRGLEGTNVPLGAPAWVTPDLLAMTIEIWQPHYKTPLTEDDALQIILNVGRLLDSIRENK